MLSAAVVALILKSTKQADVWDRGIKRRRFIDNSFLRISNAEILGDPKIFSIALTRKDKLYSITKDIDNLEIFRLFKEDGSPFTSDLRNALFVSKTHLLVAHNEEETMKYQLFEYKTREGIHKHTYSARPGTSNRGKLNTSEYYINIETSPIKFGESRIIVVFDYHLSFLRFNHSSGDLRTSPRSR